MTTSAPKATVTCFELDDAALTDIVGGDGDPHWADVDDRGFRDLGEYETFTIHVIECPDDFCDTVA